MRARRPVLHRLERRVLRSLVALPPGWALRFSGGAPVRCDDGGLLDPTIQFILALQRRRGLSGLTAATPEATRRRMRRQSALVAGVPTVVGAVHDLEVPGPDGPLPARHYTPLEGGVRPLILFFHGGGFVAGDLETHDEPCRLLCRHAGAHVLSVDYRLAPENPFPSAIEDAYAALQWALDSAGTLGADPDAVAAAGDSAGANLATVACILAVRRGGRLPVAQVLAYPPTDYHSPWPSRDLFGDGLLLTGKDIAFYHGLYTGDADPDDERHSPLRAGDLSGLPPAMVVTAAFDPLRDEGEAYAEALRAAGNRVVAWRVPGMVHGFLNLTTVSRGAHDAVVEIAGAVRAMLAGVSARESV